MKKIIIASGPVIVEDNKVLLDQHGDTDFWKFCGGRVEDFEHDLLYHAKRRSKEELGIDVEFINPVPFFMHTIKKTPEGESDVVLVHFLAKRSGEINPGTDIRKWKWIPLEELENEPLAPNIIPTLKHFNFL
jgi:8-oxo-dGTP pyrophosphatase MutT (NUDIX family)